MVYINGMIAGMTALPDPNAMESEKTPKPITPAAVILARHGQTTANRQGIILGQQDYPLSLGGTAMVQRLATLLPRTRQGLIVSSPLGRALATARIVADHTGWPVQVADGLAELSCGNWEGQRRADVAASRPCLRCHWQDAPPGGESYQATEVRVTAAIGQIKAVAGHDPILVIGHAAVFRVFLKIWLDLDPGRAMRIRIGHEHLCVLGPPQAPCRIIDFTQPARLWDWTWP